MKAVLQRVKQARVDVRGETVGAVDEGLLILLGATHSDTAKDGERLANKIAGLRIFEDEQGKMNRSVRDIQGAALVVSQFTLLADCNRGRRPSFQDAMAQEPANELFQQFVRQLQNRGVPCQTGQFGADMDVHLTNWGPVTILMDSKDKRKKT